MRFTTTNTSARPISVFEARRREALAARAAGWSRADLLWERWADAGCAAFAAGQRARARALLLAAWLVARLLPPGDRRRITARVNVALSARHPDHAALLRAADRWRAAGADIAALPFTALPRSSLYHLRMEARHRDTYVSNARHRLARIADETAETLVALAEGRDAPHRHVGRWKGERPPVFDDRRKILAACLLICGTR